MPTKTRCDKWGQPRTPYVYPAKRARGYYARALDDQGRRNNQKYFGHDRYGGVESAYALACQFAASSAAASPTTTGTAVAEPTPDRSPGTLKLNSGHRAKTPDSPLHGPRRYALATRYIRLRKHANDGWVVSVRMGRGPRRSARQFEVATYGLAVALRNAINHQLAWEKRYLEKEDQIGSDNWVRLFLYILQTHGTEPISLIDLEPPADIALLRHTVRCIRPDGRQRYFDPEEYGGRFRAHAAAIIWAIEDLSLEETIQAA